MRLMTHGDVSKPAAHFAKVVLMYSQEITAWIANTKRLAFQRFTYSTQAQRFSAFVA